MLPLPDDDELRGNTEALIDAPPDMSLPPRASDSAAGSAADGWGLANDLIIALGKARIVSRGPKATGALRAAGLPEEWSPESESSRELLHYLVEGGIAGRRIAVQLHGATDDWDPFPEFLDELRAAGAAVVPIRVYRWHPAPRNGDVDQLVAGIAEEKFDAVSFTSAPAVASVLMRATEMGITTWCCRRCAVPYMRCAWALLPRGRWCGWGCRRRRRRECGWARWPATSPTGYRCCRHAPCGWRAMCWRFAAPA